MTQVDLTAGTIISATVTDSHKRVTVIDILHDQE